MPMHTSLALFRQILRNLCLFNPLQSCEPFMGHCYSRRCSATAPHLKCHISKRTSPLEVFLSILKSSRLELHTILGLTLMVPSPHGWEAFPTPGALTHSRITWACSLLVPQVPGITPGSPLCPWSCVYSSWRGAQQWNEDGHETYEWWQWV